MLENGSFVQLRKQNALNDHFQPRFLSCSILHCYLRSVVILAGLTSVKLLQETNRINIALCLLLYRISLVNSKLESARTGVLLVRSTSDLNGQKFC